MSTETAAGEILHMLKEINVRLRIIEEALGVAYDDEGVLEPEIVRELIERVEDPEVLSEEEFWREVYRPLG